MRRSLQISRTLTFLSSKLTFLSSKLTLLSSKLTFLSPQLTFLSSKERTPLRYWLFAPELQWQSRGEWRILQGTLAPPVRTHTACAWRISQGGLRGVQDEGQAVTAGKLAAQEKSAAQSVEKLQVLTPSIPAVYP